MAGLLDLPSEILLQILALFWQQDILAVLKTCQALKAHAEPLLYRKLHWRSCDPGRRYPREYKLTRTTRTLPLAFRSIIRRPELGSYVRHFSCPADLCIAKEWGDGMPTQVKPPKRIGFTRGEKAVEKPLNPNLYLQQVFNPEDMVCLQQRIENFTHLVSGDSPTGEAFSFSHLLETQGLVFGLANFLLLFFTNLKKLTFLPNIAAYGSPALSLLCFELALSVRDQGTELPWLSRFAYLAKVDFRIDDCHVGDEGDATVHTQTITTILSLPSIRSLKIQRPSPELYQWPELPEGETSRVESLTLAMAPPHPEKLRTLLQKCPRLTSLGVHVFVENSKTEHASIDCPGFAAALEPLQRQLKTLEMSYHALYTGYAQPRHVRCRGVIQDLGCFIRGCDELKILAISLTMLLGARKTSPPMQLSDILPRNLKELYIIDDTRQFSDFKVSEEGDDSETENEDEDGLSDEDEDEDWDWEHLHSDWHRADVRKVIQSLITGGLRQKFPYFKKLLYVWDGDESDIGSMKKRYRNILATAESMGLNVELEFQPWWVHDRWEPLYLDDYKLARLSYD